MTTAKLRALAPAMVMCWALTGCGGDSSGGVNSTPSPTPTPTPAPPPAGANTSLIGTLKSESFVNDAAQGSLNISGNSVSATSGAATASFVYQASTQTYTMTVGSKSQSFGPGNADAADSSTAAAAYLIKSGTSTNGTTDSLTLTKPGTSGRFNYQYVGAALWQDTNITSSTSGNGTVYALAYGEPTPTAAVPVSGTGQYSIDMLGAYTSAGNVTGVTEQGTLIADFASDKVLLAGNDFNGIGTLSSSGGITGSFALSGAGGGSMTGRLYGPAAQEVGGSFYTSAGDGQTVGVGAFLGRSVGTAAPTDTSFASIAGSEFFSANSARQYLSGSGTDALGTLQLGLVSSGGSAQVGAVFAKDYASEFAINIPVDSLTSGSSLATVFAQSAEGARSLNNAAFINPTGGLGDISGFNTQYVRGGISGDTIGGAHFFDYFTFGFDTPASAVPTTGFAGFLVNLDGSLTSPTISPAASEITGQGTIDVNFASGQLTASGVIYNGSSSTTAPVLGNFSGTGTLGSASNAFTSSLSVAGTTSYTGNLQGNLFGPTANEVGAVFSANGTDGSNIAGVLTGAYNSTIVDPSATLATLTGTSNFATSESAYANISDISPPAQTSTQSGVTQISYDASTKTYVFTSATSGYNPGFLTPLNTTLSPANADSANSNSTFTAYSTPTVTARIFNSGANNPAIQLSYVSFADITQTPQNAINSGSSNYPVDHFEVFGLNTNATAMPTTGTASYSGVVYGRGSDPAVSSSDVSVGGTGTFNTNFGAGTLTASLNINVTPVSGGTAQSLGSFGYTGTISGSSFNTYATTPNAGGYINGAFFGPIANEIGGAFTLNTNINSSQAGNLAGVIVGKKN